MSRRWRRRLSVKPTGTPGRERPTDASWRTDPNISSPESENRARPIADRRVLLYSFSTLTAYVYRARPIADRRVLLYSYSTLTAFLYRARPIADRPVLLYSYSTLTAFVYPKQQILLTLMLLVANLVKTKFCEKSWKMTETLANWYSFDSTRNYIFQI